MCHRPLCSSPLSTARVKLYPETSVEVTAWNPVATGFAHFDMQVEMLCYFNVEILEKVEIESVNDVESAFVFRVFSTFFQLRVTRTKFSTLKQK